MYDFGARFYDPMVGRWSTMDLLAEKYYSRSPYHYALNNPVNFIDPNGLFAQKPNWAYQIDMIGVTVTAKGSYPTKPAYSPWAHSTRVDHYMHNASSGYNSLNIANLNNDGTKGVPLYYLGEITGLLLAMSIYGLIRLIDFLDQTLWLRQYIRRRIALSEVLG